MTPVTWHYGEHAQHVGVLRDTGADTPLMLMLHGGAWMARYGDWHSLEPMAAALADLGIATLNLEYRSVDNGGGWPLTFTDIVTAVRVAHHHWPARPLVLFGHSAGGHLALWAAGAHSIDAAQAIAIDAPLPLTRVIALSAVTDLVAYRRDNRLFAAALPALVGDVDRDTQRYAAASPVHHAARACPIDLIHGRLDRHVPPRQAEALAAQGPEGLTLTWLEQEDHFSVLKPDSAALGVIAASVRR